MLPVPRTAAWWLSALAVCTTAHAGDLDAQFSGYGTVAATYADTHAAAYRTSWQQSRGSRGKVDAGVDSRVGMQLDLSFDDTFSATGQALAQRLGDRGKVTAEWLYAQAQVTPETVVRAGRLVLPAFMLSDVRNVGYSQHWAHTPYEVYLTFPAVDGAQLLWRDSWQGVRFSVQPTVGRAEADMYYERGATGLTPARTVFHRLYGLSVTAEKGPWTARLGYTGADATIEWSTMPAEPLKYTFSSLGLQYDDGHLMAMAEMMIGKTDTAHYDIAGQYVTAGYRLGSWMPYATLAWLDYEGTAFSRLPDARTSAVGVRWDVVKDVAVKAQLERARYSGQQFIDVTPGTDPRKSASVGTLSVEFVF